MRPMPAVRKLHFDMLRNAAATVAFLVNHSDPESLVTYRDGAQGWTAAEVVGHLLDCERLFLERAKLTMTYDCPELPFPDQAEDVIKGRYNECDPRGTLALWQQVREEYLAYLAAIPEEGWNREGKPPKYAPFSMDDQLFLACWHDQLHIEQMTQILSRL